MLFIGLQVLEPTWEQKMKDLLVAAEQNVNVNNLNNVKERLNWQCGSLNGQQEGIGPNSLVLKSGQMTLSGQKWME